MVLEINQLHHPYSSKVDVVHQRSRAALKQKCIHWIRDVDHNCVLDALPQVHIVLCMYNRYTPVTSEAVIGCTDFLIMLGWLVGRAVAELDFVGIGHYAFFLCMVGLQLYGADILARRIGISFVNVSVYKSEQKSSAYP